MPDPPEPSAPVYRRGPRPGWWYIDTVQGTWSAQMTFYDGSGNFAAPFDGYERARPWHLFRPDDTYHSSYTTFAELCDAMAR